MKNNMHEVSNTFGEDRPMVIRGHDIKVRKKWKISPVERVHGPKNAYRRERKDWRDYED